MTTRRPHIAQKGEHASPLSPGRLSRTFGVRPGSAMAFKAALGASLLAATSTHAAGGAELAGSFFQMLCSLVLVVGIILVLCYLANRFLKLPGGNQAARYIRVVETRHLGPKKSLVLVELGGEYLLLSNTGDGVSLIKQVELVEEIEVVEERSYATMIPAGLLEKIRQAASPSGALGLCLQKKTGGIA